MDLTSLSGGDAFSFAAPKKKLDSNASMIDFSPLVDMTFQLLAFFIMTVKLANQEMVDVPLISQGKGLEVSQSTIITVLAPTETLRDPRIILGNGKDGTEIRFDDVEKAIESGVRQGKPNIVIKAERLVPTGVVQRISRVVASVSGAELFIGVADKE